MENKEFEQAAQTLKLHDLQISDFMYNTAPSAQNKEGTSLF